ncbi:MAG: hypothetical protein ABSG90_02960 [Dehalococcoidia bacterium]|jgi:hypothetical protein
MAIRNKEDAQRVLKHVPDEKRFYCHDGKILNNIFDLKTALDTMSGHTYGYHVNEEKNDFARWVKEVLGDDKLARDLTKMMEQKDAAALVAERINWLQDRA